MGCICKDTYTVSEHKESLRLLSETPFPPMPGSTDIKKIALLKKKIIKYSPEYDLGIINVLVELEKNIEKPPRQVLSSEAAVFLFSKLAPYHKSMNKKALKFYNF